MKHRLYAVLAALAVLLLIAGCSHDDPNPNLEQPISEEPEAQYPAFISIWEIGIDWTMNYDDLYQLAEKGVVEHGDNSVCVVLYAHDLPWFAVYRFGNDGYLKSANFSLANKSNTWLPYKLYEGFDEDLYNLDSGIAYNHVYSLLSEIYPNPKSETNIDDFSRTTWEKDQTEIILHWNKENDYVSLQYQKD